MGVVDELIAAREAYERQDWLVAYQSLSDLDAPELRADDFMALATTAHLLGRRNDCVQALQRAFQAHLDAGDDARAARAALWLALLLMLGGEPAVGGGWGARAQRILDGIDEDIVERGYAQVFHLFRHVGAGEFAAAFDCAESAVRYGERFDEPDLLAHGLIAKGRLLTHAGEVQRGLRIMDEAMVGVVAGDVSPIISGIVYCTLIEACINVCDYGRVTEWTTALTTWCDAQPGLVAFTGQCAVHRGQVMKLHGRYGEALDELERAAARYALTGGAPAVALVHEERGDVLRLQGDLAGARRAYDEAARSGNPAQPGRSLLALAAGDPRAAAQALDAVLADVGDPVGRTRLLPAAVEVALAAGDGDDAADRAEELAEIADGFGCPALRAASGYATGLVALAREDGAAATAALRPALEGWIGLAAAYEVARCRVALGRALRLLDDEHTATSELETARSAFAEIGALPAEREAARLLGADHAPGGLTAREVEVLRLVAAGRTNSEIAAELFVADKTVARHLSNIFTKLDVGSRTAAAAFAFEHDLVPR